MSDNINAVKGKKISRSCPMVNMVECDCFKRCAWRVEDEDGGRCAFNVIATEFVKLNSERSKNV